MKTIEKPRTNHPQWQYRPFQIVQPMAEGAWRVVAIVGSNNDRNDLLNDEIQSRIESDARLIAAAPDLLAACELALGCGDELIAEKAVRAAIAKAKGQ